MSLSYAYTILMAESKEELKSLLMRVKEESEKAVLKLNIKKTKIMASYPITSLHGKRTDVIFLDSKMKLQYIGHQRWPVSL